MDEVEFFLLISKSLGPYGVRDGLLVIPQNVKKMHITLLELGIEN
jgi:hypothetical protein